MKEGLCMSYNELQDGTLATETEVAEFPYDSRFEELSGFPEQYAKFRRAVWFNQRAFLILNLAYDHALCVIIPGDGRMFVHPRQLRYDVWIWAVPHAGYKQQVFA